MARPVPGSQLIKPTSETRFHIDYGWWERAGRDLRIYLKSHLCEYHRGVFKDFEAEGKVDWVDAESAEVTQVDGVQHALRAHCSREADYLTDKTSLVDAVFRVLLANGNQPLTALELADELGRPAATILRTLSGARVYKGLRPVVES